MTAIRLQNLGKRFGATVAVDAVNLDIRSGELFFLLGPSGCGKTTLLRMIAGFIAPSAGRIYFGDRDVTGLPPNKRHTGMVFQSYALWPHMTVAENVGFGLNVRKVARDERARRVARALDVVQMSEYAQRRPTQLSGGQQQRVALARALVVEPTVLLLDEPLSNLDAKLRLEMRTEIRRLVTATGITAIYVTHDQKEALSMADRMAVMRHGVVIQLGPPRELYDRPSSRFVADFLGETNFISGVVAEAHDGTVWIETPAGRIASRAGLDTTPTGGNVTCSIRPEAIRISRAGDGAARSQDASPPPSPSTPAGNALRGRRVQSTYLGELVQHRVELADGSSLKVSQFNPPLADALGESVEISVAAEDVVILAD
jgi:iron(III) transport system ATP-binding protein